VQTRRIRRHLHLLQHFLPPHPLLLCPLKFPLQSLLLHPVNDFRLLFSQFLAIQVCFAPSDIGWCGGDQPGPADVEPEGEEGADELAEGEEEGTGNYEGGDGN